MTGLRLERGHRLHLCSMSVGRQHKTRGRCQHLTVVGVVPMPCPYRKLDQPRSALCNCVARRISARFVVGVAIARIRHQHHVAWLQQIGQPRTKCVDSRTYLAISRIQPDDAGWIDAQARQRITQLLTTRSC